jgi:ATP-dependent RNA helicase RhlE
VEELARTLVKDPVRYGERLTAARAEPTAFDVGDKAKTHLLLHLLKEPTRTGVLVFVRTRRRAGWVAEALRRNKVLVGSLHGDRSQKQREAALDGVTQGRLHVLVATDVAARGLHVPSLRCVVNYDLPLVDQDLVHRLGRAGHGHAGFAEAFAFVDPDEADRWKRLARLCELDPRLQKVPAEAMPRELREERKQPAERKKLDPRQKARADKRARSTLGLPKGGPSSFVARRMNRPRCRLMRKRCSAERFRCGCATRSRLTAARSRRACRVRLCFIRSATR